MNLPTPTVAEVYATMMAQIELAISQTVPILPKAFIRVFAKAFAGVFVTLWKYAGSIALQLFVRTAQFGETTINGQTINPLVEWGRMIGVGDPGAGTPAELEFEVVVTTQSGFLPSNTQIVRSDTGVVYLTTGSVALNAAIVYVNAIASGDPQGNGGVGLVSTLSVGDEAAFASPIPNVRRAVVVSAVVAPGTDPETPESYRERIIRRFQRRPQGGAYADYRAWGEEPTDIVAVFPYTGLPGEVDVYVEAESTEYNPDGIPTQPQLDAVAAVIELDVGGKATRRPVNAAANVYPITRIAFDVEVNGLQGPISVSEVQDAIERAVDDHLRSREPFILGLSVFPRRDTVTAADVGGIAAEAAQAAGFYVASVVLRDESSNIIPAYTLGNGELAKLGNITFV